MTIGQQIIYASSFVGLMAIAGGFIGWQSTTKMQGQLENCTEQSLAITNALSSSQELLLNTQQMLQSGEDPGNALRKISRQSQIIANVDPESASALNSIITTYKDIGTSNTPTNLKLLRPIANRGTELIAAAHTKNDLRIKKQSAALLDEITLLGRWIIGICLGMCIVAVALGRIIASALSRSLFKLEEAAIKIRNGDFTQRIDLSARNEFGKLARTFNRLADEAEQAEIIEKQKEELESLNDQLKLKNDSLDNFVYRVSHDLKAPVINILSLQEIIKDKIDLNQDEILSRSFGFMEKNSFKLKQTVQDLLDVTRIERNLDNVKEWLNIEAIVNDVIDENQEDVEKSNTLIRLDFQEVQELYFNPLNFKNIVANLITNGIKYKKDSGQNIITISSGKNGNYLSFKVEDNGVGLDIDKHQDKLFGIFNRFHTHVEGSGVGLYIVKKLVEENGGNVSVTSEVGHGTSFNINFEVPQDELAMA